MEVSNNFKNSKEAFRFSPRQCSLLGVDCAYWYIPFMLSK